MTEKLELYRCNVCSNLVEVILNGFGELICCGQPMEHLLEQQTEDELGEKHIPEVSSFQDGQKEIRIGKHPMENEHYIMFIESISEDKNNVHLKYLYPGNEAKLTLNDVQDVLPRAFCNIHGLWGKVFSNNKGDKND